MPNGIIDPFDNKKSDIVDPLGQPKFMAASVPTPDIVSMGRQTTGGLLKDLLPKSTVPSVTTAGDIIDPFERKGPSQMMDLQDLLLPKTRPVAPPPVEEPGYLGSIAKGLYSGFRRRLPEMVGQAMQFAAPGEIVPDAGKAIAEWARQGEQRPEFQNILKDWMYQGAEMIAPSLTVPAVMAAAGTGGIPAAIATGALFGLSQAQQTKETAQKAGVEPGMAPYATGGIEAVGETIGTVALQRLFGPLAPAVSKGGKIAIRDIIKPGFSRFMKQFLGVTIPVETLTEVGQQVGEAGVEKYTGIRPDADLLKEGLSVIGPTFMLSAMTAGMAHPVNRIMAKRFETSISDPNTPEDVRQQAVNSIAQVLTDADPRLGALWKVRATIAVKDGEAIPLDEDVSEWFQSPPKQAKPEPVIAPAPAQAQPEPGVPPPVPPPPEPTPAPAPPSAPPGPVIPPVIPLQPPIIPPPVVEKPPEAPQIPIAEPGKAGAAPAPAAIPEPIPWEGPEWSEPGREVTFTNPNTDKQMRGVIRDVVLGPPDGKTPVTITVSPKWKLDQTFDLPAAEVTEPIAIARTKEYHAALEGLHPADRAQVRKDSKEFDRLLLANADLFVEPGMIDYFYEGATTPRKQAIASNEILNNARSEAGKELAIEDPYNPIQRAEALSKLRDRIERDRPGTTAPIPEAPKPTPPPAAPKPTAPPRAETAQGPVAEKPTAPVAVLKPPAEMTFKEFERAYRTAYANMNKYTAEEVGRNVFADEMAKLSDAHPDWVDIIESKIEPKPAPEKPIEPTPAPAPAPTPVPEAPAKPETALAMTFKDELHRRMIAGDKPFTNTELMIMAEPQDIRERAGIPY